MELIGFIVREFSHNSNPIEWIAGKYKEEKEVLLPMPSINPAATPIDFGKLIEIPSYIGPKTQWLLAYEISAGFAISVFKGLSLSVHSE